MRYASARSLMFLFAIFLIAGTAVGGSPVDYQKRIRAAETASRELEEVVSNGDAELEEELVSELRKLVPRTETVEIPAGTVETDNSWLAANLDELVSETDESKRLTILKTIIERLSAISASLTELEAAANTESTKDGDKQKLAEILQRPEYQKPEPAGESVFQKWWREFIEWLARVFPRPSPVPSSGTDLGSLTLGLQIIVFVIVIAIVAFLIWRFAPAVSRRFGRRPKRERQDRVILGERIGAQESADDIFSEAERLALEGDHRGAIRKGYIALLCELGDRKVVRIARHKTNRDYLRDVRDRGDLFQDMTGLTGNFERSWYGLRLAGANEWADFRDRCRQAIASVKGS